MRELIYFTKQLIGKAAGPKIDKEEKIYILLLWSVLVVLLIIEATLFFLGIKENKTIYFYFSLIGIPLGWITYFINKKLKEFKTARYLKENWGNWEEQKHNFEILEHYFSVTKEHKLYTHALDNQTWNDLNMNKIYEEMDRTYTIPGQHILYEILRNPILDEDKLKDRNNILNFFESNENLRVSMQQTLFNLGKLGGEDLAFMLWESELGEGKYKRISSIMFLAAIASLFSLLVLGLKAILFIIIPVIAINAYIKYKVDNEVNSNLSTLLYLNMLIVTASKLNKNNEEELKEYTEILDDCLVKCEKITKNVSMFLNKINDPLGLSEYIKILFLTEVRGYYKSVDSIKKYRKELQRLFNTVGEIDALISIASYKSGLKSELQSESKNCCEPKLIKNSKIIEFENMRHPLIEEPVPNSIKILESGVIITGSNMSGKSTFLRTLALNAVLAQTIYICHADSYTGSYFKIMTSISRSDDIMNGKSYYLTEAEAILDMINSIDKEIPSLIIIDEIFRGTNTRERIASSSKILNYLIERNVVPLVATHDLELEGLINEKYDKYYFSEKVGSMGLEFDYALKKGISKSGNAIKVLEFLGYPEEITKRA